MGGGILLIIFGLILVFYKFFFDFLGQKPVQTGLARFFAGLALFFLFGFGLVFSVLGL
jgi:hypothetical protein